MTLITLQDGKIVLRDGKVGTEQACCCEGCPPGSVCLANVTYTLNPCDDSSGEFLYYVNGGAEPCACECQPGFAPTVLFEGEPWPGAGFNIRALQCNADGIVDDSYCNAAATWLSNDIAFALGVPEECAAQGADAGPFAGGAVPCDDNNCQDGGYGRGDYSHSLVCAENPFP